MVESKMCGISDERLGQLCFLLLVRRQIREEVIPISARDIYDWRSFGGLSCDRDAKMVLLAILREVAKITKQPVEFPAIDLFPPKFIFSATLEYYTKQVPRKGLLVGERANDEWFAIKDFCVQSGYQFSDIEFMAARNYFTDVWWQENLKGINIYSIKQ